MHIFAVPVNLWSVLLGAVAAMILGMIWYGPLFGKKWMQLVGMTPDTMADAKKGALKSYVFMFIAALVTAYVLGVFLNGVATFFIKDALVVAFVAWLGFIATSMSADYLFNAKPKPWTLYLINAGYQLGNLLLMAVIYYYLR
jgi:hypothetical protein